MGERDLTVAQQRLLDALAGYWARHPQLRFTQLVYNFGPRQSGERSPAFFAMTDEELLASVRGDARR